LIVLLTIVGVVLISAGALVLRSFGEGFRIGRVLAGARDVSIVDAVAMAQGERAPYIRVQGRIDADEPFLDEHGRPLVVRRERVFVKRRRRWEPIADVRREVPFVLRDRTGEIEIDAKELADGIVTIPRESEGRAGEIAERFATAVDPALPVRYRVDQVSAVEHAIAAGVPVPRPRGTARLGPGGARPLILTTLELDEAMRILSGGRRLRSIFATALLATGVACIVLALILAVIVIVFSDVTFAASPTPSAAPVGDTRSSGEGPGLVGQPVVIALGVVALGALTAGVTILVARLSGARRR
jgi:hypothetical protein